MVEEIRNCRDIIDLLDGSIEDTDEQEKREIESGREEVLRCLEDIIPEMESFIHRSPDKIEEKYDGEDHTGICDSEHYFGWYMTLYGPERHIDDHRPYIADTQEYSHEERGTDDETEEEDAREMENDPYRSPHAYHPKEIFQEEFSIRYFWHHDLRHDSILAKFCREVKDLLTGSAYSK